jgi:DNA-binding NtrC family response regulator
VHLIHMSRGSRPGAADQIAAAVARLVETAVTSAPGWAVWKLLGDGATWREDVARAARDSLTALGFVVSRPAGDVLTEELRHRQVVLFCQSVADCRAAWSWIETLTRASPRRHVLAVFDPRLERPHDFDPPDRAGPLLSLAERAIASLDFERAAALLSAVSLGATSSGPALTLRSELDFWTGQFAHVTAEAAPALTEVEAWGWRGLSAWAQGDIQGCVKARQVMHARRTREPCGRTRFWKVALDLLAAPGTGDTARIAAFIRGAPRDRLGVAVGVAVEVLLARGARDQAKELLFGVASADRRSAAVRDWLVERTDGRTSSPVRGVEARLRRIGGAGILRFGHGRDDMRWLHLIPALLEIVRDAEDDNSALSGACRWLTRHAGAPRAAILDDPRHRVLAADGWTSAELAREPFRAATADGTASSPLASAFREADIRYSGRRIGCIVISGSGEALESLQPALDAAAALIAPAVRARLDAITARAGARDVLLPEILGRSPAIAALRHEIARAAAVPFPVLVEGESGTGKELVARAVHRLSPRRDRRFCAINCAALTDELLEAELFGHARGAFTGAVALRLGLFEDAHAGTLFLDEVSELSLRAQAKLLRVVQEREVRRVGENVSRSIDVRLVAATNLPLGAAVEHGRFRADLQFRLAVIRLTLPPLRDRREDIPVLAETFWRHFIGQTSKRARLGADAISSLCRHRWPGNVRELQNAVASLVVLAPERGRVGARHVEQTLASGRAEPNVVPLEAARRSFEQQAVAEALARHAGRRAAAARELGLSRQGLTKAIKRLGLDRQVERAGVA